MLSDNKEELFGPFPAAAPVDAVAVPLVRFVEGRLGVDDAPTVEFGAVTEAPEEVPVPADRWEWIPRVEDEADEVDDEQREDLTEDADVPNPAGAAVRRLRRPRRAAVSNRTVLGVAAGVAAVVIVGGVGVAALSSGDEARVPAPMARASSAAGSTPAAAGGCSAASPPAVRTQAAGNRLSGPGVIAAFEHAFYVARDAGKARELIAPASRKPSLTDLRTGIAQSFGRTHCVTITPTAKAGAFDVSLAVSGGGAPDQTYEQTITTGVGKSGAEIISIEARK